MDSSSVVDAYFVVFYVRNSFSFNQIKSNQIYLTTQKSKINKQMKMKK